MGMNNVSSTICWSHSFVLEEADSLYQFSLQQKLYMSLTVCELVQTCSDSCESTAWKDRVTGEKGPATELELGTYNLSQSFSYASDRSRSGSSIPNRPFGTGDASITSSLFPQAVDSHHDCL